MSVRSLPNEATNTTILLVEDDPAVAEALHNLLNLHKFKVIKAENGIEAQSFLKCDDLKIDLVLSDIRMPNMNGIELLDWVRRVYDSSFKNFQALPFLLLSGFQDDLNIENIKALSADGVFSKPLEFEKLKSAIFEKLQIKDLDNQSKDDNPPINEYCKVSMEDFVANKELDMDIYIKLRRDKFIKVSSKGKRIDSQRIERYREKGLEHLYIEKKEFRKVLDFNIMLSKVITETERVCSSKRLRFLTHTNATIMENCFVNGIDEKAFDDAKEFLKTSLEVLTEEKETFDLLQALNGHADFLYAHSLGVSIYSVMIARKMGWNSSATQFKLSFGGVMHNIGKKEIDPDILQKPRNQLTYKEREIIETHPLRGKEILESLKSAPADVVEICFQHHENELGQGYPRRLESKQIHPMAKVVSAADLFCGYALKNPHHPGVHAAKAIQLMEIYKKDQTATDVFEALKSVVKTCDMEKTLAS